jgi:hypothetical protein
MIFWVWFGLSLVGAVAHLAIQHETPRTRARVVEILLLYFLAVYYGFAAFVSGLGHLLLATHLKLGPSGWPTEDAARQASEGR